jgi:hypothetical protein
MHSVSISMTAYKRAIDMEPQDFSFIIGHERHVCSLFAARILSPRIARMLEVDPTFSTFVIDTKGGFSDLIRFSCGEPLTIAPDNVEHLLYLCEQLENQELLQALHEYRSQQHPLTVSNVIPLAARKCKHRVDFDAECDFIATHLYEFTADHFRGHDPFVLELVLQNPYILLSGENKLFDMIVALGSSYRHLLKYVHLEFLDHYHRQDFIRMVRATDIDEIMWASLSGALLTCHPEEHECDIPRFGRQIYVLSISDPFRGILARLSNECRGNVHERGVVRITSSGDGQGHPWQVTDPRWESHWWGCGSDTPWICFDFLEKTVCLSDYSLRAAEITFDYLRTWVLEGSNTGNDWTTIDQQSANREISAAHAMRSWHVGHSGRFYRYVRLKQTGNNSGGTRNLNLSGIEFFGVLKRLPDC